MESSSGSVVQPVRTLPPFFFYLTLSHFKYLRRLVVIRTVTKLILSQIHSSQGYQFQFWRRGQFFAPEGFS
jgi:hypothetical protein